MEKIKTVEEAFKKQGLDPENLPRVSSLPEKHQKAIIAHYILIIVTEALNDGWVPDWNNQNQYKYFPWFEVKASKSKPAGFGFSLTFYGRSGTDTSLGSRLCFKSSELALYAAEQFKDLYEEYFLLK